MQRHALAVAHVTTHGRVDNACVLRQLAVKQSRIRAADLAPRHGRRQGAIGVVVAGDHHESRRVLVEAVHDPGPRRAAAADAAGQQAVHQRALLVARRRVHDHPRCLVDHQEPVVLVHDLDVERFRSKQ